MYPFLKKKVCADAIGSEKSATSQDYILLYTINMIEIYDNFQTQCDVTADTEP